MSDMNQQDMQDEDQEHDAKELAEKILDVQVAKMKEPELYKQAMAILADQKDVINNLDDLKKVAQKKMVAAAGGGEDDSE